MMESKHIIKLSILIILCFIIYVYNRKKNREHQKVNTSILKKTNSKKPGKYSHRKSIKEKEKETSILKTCIPLLIGNENAEKVNRIIDESFHKNKLNRNWTVVDQLINSDLLNYTFKNHVYLYARLDWKAESLELEDFIEKALKSNFNINKSFDAIIDLSKDKFIHEVFPKYEIELSKLGIKLRNIDVNSDSYQIVLVSEGKLELLENLIKSIGLKLTKISS